MDEDGFGGHTPLFSAVVSQPHYRINQHGGRDEAPYVRLLLDCGADPNARVAPKENVAGYIADDDLREYRNVTSLAWGSGFTFRR